MPAHGGSDPGTSGNGIIEKDFNLKLSKYMNDRFKALGLDSKLSRETDETLGPSSRPNRIQSLFGKGNDVIVVSNHINSGGGQGSEIIYALRNNDTLSKKIAAEFQNNGQTVRKYYQRRLPSNPSKDYYYLLRDTPNNESIIVEYGFIDNNNDVDKLKNDWQNLAEAVIKAVSEYAGVTYVPVISANYYTVKSGDSLWSIAKKYNTTVTKLKEKNNLSSNLLKIGQILYLPNEDISDNLYTVQKGDTLYSIANKNNTTVAEIKTLNNLTSNTLSVNQKLKLPIKEEYQTYTVQKGDTLYSIARKFNTTVSKIENINNLTSSNLSIGQKLLIP